MKYECGNADICQEIDNSNKLVAKRSNSLPNGTILPLLPMANQTICARTDARARARTCVQTYYDAIRYEIYASR